MARFGWRIGYASLMAAIVAFLESLNAGNWIAIVVALLGILLWYLTPLRDRWHKQAGTVPEVQATINRDAYPGGWRPVQLHFVTPPGAQNVDIHGWCILRASLLRPPWPAVLARAENDDYASRVFYADDPVRTLNGRAEGRPQRFALEFFIHFRQDDDRGRWAKFQVTYTRLSTTRKRSVKVWVQVPMEARSACLSFF